MNFKEFLLQEGVYDPGIFKAFFMAGGPGSGKAFISQNTFAGTGLKSVNMPGSYTPSCNKNSLNFIYYHPLGNVKFALLNSNLSTIFTAPATLSTATYPSGAVTL